MKKIILLLVLTIILISCDNDNANNPVDSPKIKIAAILDFTGDYSQCGLASRQAMELLKKYNSNFEVSYYDCQCKNAPADSILDYIISTGEKPVIVSLSSWVSNYIATKVSQNNMLHIPLGSAAFSYSNLNSSIKMTESVGDECAFMSNLLNTYNKIAIMYFKNDLGTTWNNALQTSLTGKIVVTEPYNVTQTDFTAELTRIKNNSPDVIVLVGTKEAVTIAKQAKSMGINAQLVGTRPIFSDFLLNEEACEGLIFTYPKIDYSVNYLSDYQSQYGYKADSFAAESFDLVNILLNANSLNKTTPSEIVGWLKNNTFTGCLGKISFDSLCEANYNFTYMIVKDGSFEEMK